MRKRRSRTIIVAVAVTLGAAAIGFAAIAQPALLASALESLGSLVGTAGSAAAVPGSRAEDGGTRSIDAGEVVRRQTAPLSSAQLGAPLVHGTFVAACGAPDDMKVVVKATVKMGHAVTVTVKTDPSNPMVASCVEHATRDLQWDISPKSAQVTVTY